MQKRRHALPTLLLFLFLSFLLVLLAQTPPGRFLTSLLEVPLAFVGKSFLSIPQSFLATMENEDVQKLREENVAFRKKMLDLQLLERENKALKDQFISEKPPSALLLPAGVVAAPRFIPGVSALETLIIDKGERDGVLVGQAVMFGGHLVGKVARTSQVFSEVVLVVHPNFSSTAKTANSQALGVVRGQGGGKIVFDNVLLSETLSVSDVVVPFGEGDASFVLLPPDVAVGTITVVEKNPSDLFQSAAVRSALDFSKLSTVFVYMGVEE